MTAIDSKDMHCSPRSIPLFSSDDGRRDRIEVPMRCGNQARKFHLALRASAERNIALESESVRYKWVRDVCLTVLRETTASAMHVHSSREVRIVSPEPLDTPHPGTFGMLSPGTRARVSSVRGRGTFRLRSARRRGPGQGDEIRVIAQRLEVRQVRQKRRLHIRVRRGLPQGAHGRLDALGSDFRS